MTQPVRPICQENQTGDASFQVVLNGLLPNVSRIDVRAKLAALFKVTPEQIDKLLATPVCVVKRPISLAGSTSLLQQPTDANGTATEH